jgi:hypothetical protein
MAAAAVERLVQTVTVRMHQALAGVMVMLVLAGLAAIRMTMEEMGTNMMLRTALVVEAVAVPAMPKKAAFMAVGRALVVINNRQKLVR